MGTRTNIALPRLLLVQNVFLKIVTDFSFDFRPKETIRGKQLHQIGFEKRDSMQSSAPNREYFETSRKSKAAPNVELEPMTLRSRVSCSTDWASRAPYAIP